MGIATVVLGSSFTPGSRRHATRTPSSRDSFGNDFAVRTPFQAALPDTPDQASPLPASDEANVSAVCIRIFCMCSCWHGATQRQLVVPPRGVPIHDGKTKFIVQPACPDPPLGGFHISFCENVDNKSLTKQKRPKIGLPYSGLPMRVTPCLDIMI